MSNPFASERLIYRAPESPDDEDFFLAIQTDPFGYTNSNFSISKPQDKKSAREYLKHVVEETILGIVICIPAVSGALVDGQPAKPTPIGCIHLDKLGRNSVHHRHCTVGIDIVPQFQGKGYGSEAIRWALHWAFETAGLHRVNIDAFGFNPGAKRLYERLGFKLEGTRREFLWHKGQWWDDYQLGMLEHEWRDLNREQSSTA